ncbi:inactive heparanase-2 isoform X2 [Procambarus clarkii]|uniref:inactive heparanase-2 isoform X2 n=1 Tax=Procambarus clarkii TaxID=6728 RepID=UPI003743C17C
MQDWRKVGVVKTGVAKTGVAKTGVAKTGVAKTGVAKTGVAKTGVADVDEAQVVREVPDTFLSVALGPRLIQHQWFNFNTSSPLVLTLTRALAPAILRMGGSAANFLTYEPRVWQLPSSPDGLLRPDTGAPVPSRHVLEDDQSGDPSLKNDRNGSDSRNSHADNTTEDERDITYSSNTIWTNYQHSRSQSDWSPVSRSEGDAHSDVRDGRHPDVGAHSDIRDGRHPDGGLDDRSCNTDHDSSTFTNFTMTRESWSQLLGLAEAAGMTLLFDVNQFYRAEDGSWDPSNVRLLMRDAAARGARLIWQLGNEPNAYGHKFGWSVTGQEAAQDYLQLRQELDQYFPGPHHALVVGPDVTRPKPRGQQEPDVIRPEPRGQQEPDVTRPKPRGQQEPDVTRPEPRGQQEPDVTRPEPLGQQEPDVTRPKPRGQQEPDVTRPKPRGQQEPDVTRPKPRGQQEPDVTRPEPLGQQEPDVTRPKPEGQQEPDVTRPKPGGQQEPDVTRPEPRGQQEPDVTRPKPEGQQEPDVTRPKPGGQQEPDVTRPEPRGQQEPDVTRPKPRGQQELYNGVGKESIAFLREFLSSLKFNLSALSWHQYYLDGRTAQVDDFLSPAVMDQFKWQIDQVVGVRDHLSPGTPIWLTETGSAYGGGARGLSDAYVGGFLWLDKLGVAATMAGGDGDHGGQDHGGHEGGGIQLVARQTLYEGCYALISMDLVPNPDYWLSVLYKRLVGGRVLRLRLRQVPPTTRLYAHCLRNITADHTPGSVVVFGMNLLKEATQVRLEGHLATSPLLQYLLLPPDGDLQSRQVMLNGQLLQMTPEGDLPDLTPTPLPPALLHLPPTSLGFWVVPHAHARACM